MITVDNLSLCINNKQLLKDISFSANKGDIIGVVGYSGSGKTSLLKSIVNIDKKATGKIEYSGKLGFLYQNAKNSIAPNYKIITQVCDGVGKLKLAKKLLGKLGLDDYKKSYVDLISGGQQMRASLAINLHREPNILLLDEPTANLDEKNTQLVVKELLSYAQKTDCILIWVSHDMKLMEKITNKIIHINNGTISEYTDTKRFFKSPSTKQGKDLLQPIPIKKNKNKTGDTITTLKNVALGYNNKPVIKDLSFNVSLGECVGLFGESGIGKSTIFRGIMGQLNPISGTIKKSDNIQMIFQDARGALNPKLTILDIVSEPLGNKYSAEEKKQKVIKILNKVGIDESRIFDKPNQFAGGECQRISIGRAFISNPDLILADEITSALDSYNKNMILKLIYDLQAKFNTAIIFASHDYEAIQSISHKVIKL